MKMVHPGDADSKGVGWFQGSAFLGQTIICPRILRPVIREHTQKHRCKLSMNSMFKWKWGDFCPVSLNYLVLCLVAQLCLTLCHPMNCKPTRLLCPWGFSKKEYWSGLPCPPPRDLPDVRIEPATLMFPALAGWSFTTSTIWEAHRNVGPGESWGQVWTAC